MSSNPSYKSFYNISSRSSNISPKRTSDSYSRSETIRTSYNSNYISSSSNSSVSNDSAFRNLNQSSIVTSIDKFKPSSFSNSSNYIYNQVSPLSNLPPPPTSSNSNFSSSIKFRESINNITPDKSTFQENLEEKKEFIIEENNDELFERKRKLRNDLNYLLISKLVLSESDFYRNIMKNIKKNKEINFFSYLSTTSTDSFSFDYNSHFNLLHSLSQNGFKEIISNSYNLYLINEIILKNKNYINEIQSYFFQFFNQNRDNSFFTMSPLLSSTSSSIISSSTTQYLDQIFSLLYLNINPIYFEFFFYLIENIENNEENIKDIDDNDEYNNIKNSSNENISLNYLKFLLKKSSLKIYNKFKKYFLKEIRIFKYFDLKLKSLHQLLLYNVILFLFFLDLLIFYRIIENNQHLFLINEDNSPSSSLSLSSTEFTPIFPSSSLNSPSNIKNIDELFSLILNKLSSSLSSSSSLRSLPLPYTFNQLISHEYNYFINDVDFDFLNGILYNKLISLLLIEKRDELKNKKFLIEKILLRKQLEDQKEYKSGGIGIRKAYKKKLKEEEKNYYVQQKNGINNELIKFNEILSSNSSILYHFYFDTSFLPSNFQPTKVHSYSSSTLKAKEKECFIRLSGELDKNLFQNNSNIISIFSRDILDVSTSSEKDYFTETKAKNVITPPRFSPSPSSSSSNIDFIFHSLSTSPIYVQRSLINLEGKENKSHIINYYQNIKRENIQNFFLKLKYFDKFIEKYNKKIKKYNKNLSKVIKNFYFLEFFLDFFYFSSLSSTFSSSISSPLVPSSTQSSTILNSSTSSFLLFNDISNNYFLYYSTYYSYLSCLNQFSSLKEIEFNNLLVQDLKNCYNNPSFFSSNASSFETEFANVEYIYQKFKENDLNSYTEIKKKLKKIEQDCNNKKKITSSLSTYLSMSYKEQERKMNIIIEDEVDDEENIINFDKELRSEKIKEIKNNNAIKGKNIENENFLHNLLYLLCISINNSLYITKNIKKFSSISFLSSSPLSTLASPTSLSLPLSSFKSLPMLSSSHINDQLKDGRLLCLLIYYFFPTSFNSSAFTDSLLSTVDFMTPTFLNPISTSYNSLLISSLEKINFYYPSSLLSKFSFSLLQFDPLHFLTTFFSFLYQNYSQNFYLIYYSNKIKQFYNLKTILYKRKLLQNKEKNINSYFIKLRNEYNLNNFKHHDAGKIMSSKERDEFLFNLQVKYNERFNKKNSCLSSSQNSSSSTSSKCPELIGHSKTPNHYLSSTSPDTINSSSNSVSSNPSPNKIPSIKTSSNCSNLNSILFSSTNIKKNENCSILSSSSASSKSTPNSVSSSNSTKSTTNSGSTPASTRSTSNSVSSSNTTRSTSNSGSTPVTTRSTSNSVSSSNTTRSTSNSGSTPVTTRSTSNSVSPSNTTRSTSNSGSTPVTTRSNFNSTSSTTKTNSSISHSTSTNHSSRRDIHLKRKVSKSNPINNNEISLATSSTSSTSISPPKIPSKTTSKTSSKSPSTNSSLSNNKSSSVSSISPLSSSRSLSPPINRNSTTSFHTSTTSTQPKSILKVSSFSEPSTSQVFSPPPVSSISTALVTPQSNSIISLSSLTSTVSRSLNSLKEILISKDQKSSPINSSPPSSPSHSGQKFALSSPTKEDEFYDCPDPFQKKSVSFALIPSPSKEIILLNSTTDTSYPISNRSLLSSFKLNEKRIRKIRILNKNKLENFPSHSSLFIFRRIKRSSQDDSYLSSSIDYSNKKHIKLNGSVHFDHNKINQEHIDEREIIDDYMDHYNFDDIVYVQGELNDEMDEECEEIQEETMDFEQFKTEMNNSIFSYFDPFDRLVKQSHGEVSPLINIIKKKQEEDRVLEIIRERQKERDEENEKEESFSFSSFHISLNQIEVNEYSSPPTFSNQLNSLNHQYTPSSVHFSSQPYAFNHSNDAIDTSLISIEEERQYKIDKSQEKEISPCHLNKFLYSKQNLEIKKTKLTNLENEIKKKRAVILIQSIYRMHKAKKIKKLKLCANTYHHLSSNHPQHKTKPRGRPSPLSSSYSSLLNKNNEEIQPDFYDFRFNFSILDDNGETQKNSLDLKSSHQIVEDDKVIEIQETKTTENIEAVDTSTVSESFYSFEDSTPLLNDSSIHSIENVSTKSFQILEDIEIFDETIIEEKKYNQKSSNFENLNQNRKIENITQNLSKYDQISVNNVNTIPVEKQEEILSELRDKIKKIQEKIQYEVKFNSIKLQTCREIEILLSDIIKSIRFLESYFLFQNNTTSQCFYDNILLLFFTSNICEYLLYIIHIEIKTKAKHSTFSLILEFFIVLMKFNNEDVLNQEVEEENQRKLLNESDANADLFKVSSHLLNSNQLNLIEFKSSSPFVFHPFFSLFLFYFILSDVDDINIFYNAIALLNYLLKKFLNNNSDDNKKNLEKFLDSNYLYLNRIKISEDIIKKKQHDPLFLSRYYNVCNTSYNLYYQ